MFCRLTLVDELDQRAGGHLGGGGRVNVVPDSVRVDPPPATGQPHQAQPSAHPHQRAHP
jgi:hypothetical protein